VTQSPPARGSWHSPAALAGDHRGDDASTDEDEHAVATVLPTSTYTCSLHRPCGDVEGDRSREPLTEAYLRRLVSLWYLYGYRLVSNIYSSGISIIINKIA
jgi:hypothetical protein